MAWLVCILYHQYTGAGIFLFGTEMELTSCGEQMARLGTSPSRSIRKSVFPIRETPKQSCSVTRDLLQTIRYHGQARATDWEHSVRESSDDSTAAGYII